MITQQRKISGTVLSLRCMQCEAEFPHFLFSGEEDTDTAGLCSLSSIDADELIIGELEIEEWNNFDTNGALHFEHRLSEQLNRHDLKVVRLLRVEQAKNVGNGMNFQDFRKAYNPPAMVFSCICCVDGESRTSEEITVENFQSLGGKISPIGRLVL